MDDSAGARRTDPSSQDPAGTGADGAPRTYRPIPAGLDVRARAWLAGEIGPGRLRDAATVALVRDGGAGMEVYLQRRVTSMAFAAGMHVFPGGGIDPRDDDPSLRWAGPDAGWWGAAFGCDPGLARALVCAVVRETFEESGVVLAGTSAHDVVADVSDDSWEADRQALLAREVALSDLLRRRGLVLRSDLLRPWAHWITPEFEERRFDTRFFVAALPEGQRTRHVGGEADSVRWLRPDAALAAHRAGELPMLPPTVAVLESLAAAGDVAGVLAATPRIVPIMPRPERGPAGGLRLVVEEPPA